MGGEKKGWKDIEEGPEKLVHTPDVRNPENAPIAELI